MRTPASSLGPANTKRPHEFSIIQIGSSYWFATHRFLFESLFSKVTNSTRASRVTLLLLFLLFFPLFAPFSTGPRPTPTPRRAAASFPENLAKTQFFNCKTQFCYCGTFVTYVSMHQTPREIFKCNNQLARGSSSKLMKFTGFIFVLRFVARSM